MSELHADFRALHDGSVCGPILLNTGESGNPSVTRFIFVSRKLQEEIKSASTNPEGLAMSASAALLNYWARKFHNLTIFPDGNTGTEKAFRLFPRNAPDWRHDEVSHGSEAFAGQDIWIEGLPMDQKFSAESWFDNWEHSRPNESSVRVGLEGSEGSTTSDTATLTVLFHREQDFEHLARSALESIEKGNRLDPEVTAGESEQTATVEPSAQQGDGQSN